MANYKINVQLFIIFIFLIMFDHGKDICNLDPILLSNAELNQTQKPSRLYTIPISVLETCVIGSESDNFRLDFVNGSGLFLDDYLPMITGLQAACRALVMNHNITGLVFDTDEQAVEAVKQVHTIDRAGVRRRFEQRFTDKIMTDNYVKLFERIVERNEKQTTAGAVSEATLSTSLSSHHNHSLTMVTALMDIGRGNWTRFTRPLNKYLEFMRNMLHLRVPMVVTVDQNSSVEFVHKERARIGWSQWTQIRQMSLRELPLTAFLPRIRQIMKNELAHWRPEWDPEIRTHPEANNPEYVVVTNSKPWFVLEAMAQNPFKTENFAWMDAGYGHGDGAIFPANWQWRPKFTPGKISLIKLIHTDSVESYSIGRLYRKNVAVINGGVFVGNLTSIHRFCISWQRMFKELMDKNIVDDDQTYMTLLINQHPDWFTLTEGDWYDAFKLI